MTFIKRGDGTRDLNILYVDGVDYRLPDFDWDPPADFSGVETYSWILNSDALTIRSPLDRLGTDPLP